MRRPALLVVLFACLLALAAPAVASAPKPVTLKPLWSGSRLHFKLTRAAKVHVAAKPGHWSRTMRLHRGRHSVRLPHRHLRVVRLSVRAAKRPAERFEMRRAG